nr:aldo/keto reductase [bacterium]
MEQTYLWPGGARVSRLALGTLTMGPLQCALPVEQGANLIRYAASRGINMVDTAEYYDTYPYIGRAMVDYPNLVVCTKSYAYTKEMAQESFEKACRGIGRDYIDVFLLHEQESEHTLRGHAEALEHWITLKQKGYIGAVGLSTHYVAAVEAAAKSPMVDVIHPIFNMEGLGICDGTREDMERALQKAKAAGKGIYAMKALGGGHLIGRADQALAFVAGKPYVDAFAVGMQREDEVDYNIALVEGSPVPQEAASRLAKQERKMMVHDYCRGCGTCVKRCPFGAISLVDGRAVPDEKKCVRCGYCAKVCPDFCIKVV